ncbi:MAG: hypothetical protein ACRYGR_08300 [Janthinobacterium lividum]
MAEHIMLDGSWIGNHYTVQRIEEITRQWIGQYWPDKPRMEWDDVLAKANSARWYVFSICTLQNGSKRVNVGWWNKDRDEQYLDTQEYGESDTWLGALVAALERGNNRLKKNGEGQPMRTVRGTDADAKAIPAEQLQALALACQRELSRTQNTFEARLKELQLTVEQAIEVWRTVNDSTGI